MSNATKTYSLTDTPSDEIPGGYERISLVTTDYGMGEVALFQVERSDGSFYLCDADGDKTEAGEWILQRVLADIPADDSDAFFEAIEATAKRIETE